MLRVACSVNSLERFRAVTQQPSRTTQRAHIIFNSVSAISEGVGATPMPASLKAAILAAAVPLPPLTMAPAWPMRRPGRRGGARNEAGDGLPAVAPDPGGGFFFSRAADFADHDDAVRVRVGVEELDDVQVRGAVDRVAADADAGGLADAAAGELPDGFVGQRAAARHHADMALLVNVAGRNADAAAALRILARCRA